MPPREEARTLLHRLGENSIQASLEEPLGSDVPTVSYSRIDYCVASLRHNLSSIEKRDYSLSNPPTDCDRGPLSGNRTFDRDCLVHIRLETLLQPFQSVRFSLIRPLLSRCSVQSEPFLYRFLSSQSSQSLNS